MSHSEGPFVAVDFDGTVVDHRFPKIGQPVPHALSVMRRLHDLGFKLILWTMRSDEFLNEAKDYFDRHKIDLFGVNQNPQQSTWTRSPKAYAHYYIDDAAVGCPLLVVTGFARPCVAARVYVPSVLVVPKLVPVVVGDFSRFTFPIIGQRYPKLPTLTEAEGIAMVREAFASLERAAP